MPTVPVHGSPVHYAVQGEGPGLLLVHAAGTDSATTFGQIAGDLAAHHTVISPDFAGSGHTPAGDAPLTLDLLADQVVGAAAAVTDEPFDLVGFSLGSLVAATAAAAHPGRVRRLVLLCGWARDDDPRQRYQMALWQHLARTDEQAYRAYTLLSVFSGPFLAAAGADGIKEAEELIRLETGVRRQMDLGAAADLRDRLPRVTAPTLVVGATRDHWIPAEHARELHRAIPTSHYTELDCGHMAVHERPADVTRLLTDFLA